MAGTSFGVYVAVRPKKKRNHKIRFWAGYSIVAIGDWNILYNKSVKNILNIDLYDFLSLFFTAWMRIASVFRCVHFASMFTAQTC